MRLSPCVGRAIIALSFFSFTSAADTADAVRAMQAAREASAKMEGRDFEAAVEKLAAATQLRPDFPQLWLDLAAAQAGAGQHEEAIATLQRYAKLGLSTAVDRAEEFAALRSRKEFQDVAKQVAANAHPKGKGEIGFTLRDVTGLMEGIAWREKSDQFYFGDVHHRTVWTRNKDGTLARFTPEGDELWGVFGLALDEAGGTLWAATSAVPAMRGFSPEMAGSAALAEIDLESGAVRRTIPLPRAARELVHVLSDVALAPDGSVLLTDSGVPIVWRLPPGGQALERLPESPECFALHGLTVLPSGIAILSDQVNGILRLDPAGRTVTRLDAPADATLVEIKGLAVSAEGRVLALQTDLRPSRVLALELDAAAESIASVAVLESGHIAMGAPSLGCIGTGGDFYFIGNAGWSRFSDPDPQPTPPRQVPIFRTKLPKQ